MKYALGNMLNGAGGLNADQLALDLPFAVTKSLTAAKGPTPTFTRASSGTFVGSDGLIQSAGNNVARFDHDPVTLASRGLLIEESRTNSITHSESMTVANGWNEDLGAGTVAWSDNATTAPTGALTADKLTEASTSSARRITTKSASTVNGTTYILSVYAKASDRSILQIATSTGFVTATQNFDLSNGVLGTGGVAGASIVDVGSGWYRCSMQVVSNATGSSFFAFGIVPLANSARFTSYNGIIGYGIFLWGAQLEAGSFATSYIPTTTTSVVRSADVCSIFGTDFTGIWNYDEGTIYAAFDQSQSNVFGAILTAARSDDTGKVQIGRATSSQIYLAIKNNANVETFIYNPTSSIAAGLNKSALAYKVNDSIGTINNLSSPLDTLVSLGTPDRLLIANDSVGSGRRHNGTISAVRVYKKRLPLSKLQTLTAP